MFVELFYFIIFVVNVSKLEYIYNTKYIDVPVDHFSYTTNGTFMLKYLINDTYHLSSGPIFFYTGNEAAIEVFAQNTGFMNDIAGQFNALLVFAEHRYYGTSLPFGNLSFTTPKYLGYLSSEQALADFVYLINELQKEYSKKLNVKKAPVVAFGGSYGGMLAAWLRMKYPSSVIGAIASSAPIWQFPGLTPCENFNRICSDVFTVIGGNICSDTLKISWKIIRSFTTNDNGKSTLSKMWNLCFPLKTNDDIQNLVDWLTDVYVNLVMVNYPYPTNFLADLPANPVYEFCSKINNHNVSNDAGVLQAIGKAIQVYTNYTGSTKCTNTRTSSANLNSNGWDFQACTEMIMPICSTDFDIFENAHWDFKTFSDDCYTKYGIRPRSEEVPILKYGGKDINAASNIVFTNGLMDPWSSGGVLNNVNNKLLAYIITDGAHHFDLRGENKADTSNVRAARHFHINQISRWLSEYYSALITKSHRNKVNIEII